MVFGISFWLDLNGVWDRFLVGLRWCSGSGSGWIEMVFGIGFWLDLGCSGSGSGWN